MKFKKIIHLMKYVMKNEIQGHPLLPRKFHLHFENETRFIVNAMPVTGPYTIETEYFGFESYVYRNILLLYSFLQQKNY